MKRNQKQADASDQIREYSEFAGVEQRGSLADRLLAIGRAAAPEWWEPWRSTAHGEILYGDNGLPR